MAFELPPLLYAEDALEPVISGRTLSFHHGKHHKAYVDNLNKLTEGTDSRRNRSRTSSERSPAMPPERHLQQRRPGLEPHLFWNCMRAAAAVRRAASLASASPRPGAATRSSPRSSKLRR